MHAVGWPRFDDGRRPPRTALQGLYPQGDRYSWRAPRGRDAADVLAHRQARLRRARRGRRRRGAPASSTPAYAEAGVKIADARHRCGRSRRDPEGARARPRRDRAHEGRRRAHLVHLAGAEPRAAREAAEPRRRPCWRWTPCRAPRARSAWTRCRRRRTWPAIARSSRRRAHFGRPLGAQTTAAGRIKPARVLVIGAGVAGLAAVAAARALGAVVSALRHAPDGARAGAVARRDLPAVRVEGRDRRRRRRLRAPDVGRLPRGGAGVHRAARQAVGHHRHHRAGAGHRRRPSSSRRARSSRCRTAR